MEVLQKATQNNPKDRHQDIYEFWKDFARLKKYAVEEGEIKTEVATRSAGTPKAHVARGYTPLAPQKPDFNTSKELRFENNQVLKNPALVVKVDNAAKLNQFQNHNLNNIPTSQPPLITNHDELVFQEEIDKPKRKKSFARRFATFLVVICVFTGILYATHSILRGVGILPEIKMPFSKPTGTANSDVNLRVEGDPESQKIGVVPKNSRVRIVNSKDNWYEVDIIEFGRPKENSTDAEHGWVNKRYINVDN